MKPESQTPEDGADTIRLRELVQRVVHAEAALQAHLGGEVDAIIPESGHPFLLNSAQQELIRSEDVQRKAAEIQTAILDALPANIALVNPHGSILVVNEAWRAFGTANAAQGEDFFVGRNYLEICEKAEGDCAVEAQATAAGIRGVLKGELPFYSLEYPCHSPTEKCWYRVMVTPVSQGLNGAVIMHINVTERLLAEQALREREQEFRTLSEALPQIVWVARPDGQAIHFNQRWMDFTGLTLAESLGHGWNPPFHPEDRPRAAELWKAAIASGERYEIEYRLRRADGVYRWMLGRALPLHNTNGEIVKWLGSCTDIEEFKQAQASLRESADRLAAAQAQAHLGNWEVDLATGRGIWSDELFRLLYRDPTPEAPDFETFLQLVHPEDRRKAEEILSRQAELRDPLVFDYRTHPTLGPIRHLQANIHVERDANDQPVRNSGTVLDITERKLAEAEMQRANETLEGIVAALQELGTSDLPLPEIMNLLVARAQNLTRADGAVIAFLEGDEMVYHAVTGTAATHRGLRLPLHASLSGSVVLKGRPMICEDTETDDQVDREACRKLELRSMIVTPLRAQGRIVGVLKVLSNRPHSFSTRDLANLQILVESLCTLIERQRSTDELARSNRALHVLSTCNEALIRAESEAGLLETICRVAVEVGGARLAWVGYARDDDAKSVEPQTHAGAEDGFVSALNLSWAEDAERGQGPVGQSIRTGEPVMLPDLAHSDYFRPWLEAAQALGFRSMISLPLKSRDRTFGVLVIYLAESRRMPADEQRLMRELADDMAFGIVHLRARDESARHQKEIARQAALLDKATDAIFVRDLDHRVTYWNRGAESIYGWTAAKVRGRHLAELLKVDATKFEEADKRVRETGEWNGEIRVTAKDGSLRVADSRWSLLRDETGKPLSILTIDTDVTERRKLEKQFLRAQRMESIGTLAGGVAHDLNNVLAPIVMGVGLLRQYMPDAGALNVIGSIEQSAKRGTELVKQVLTFARGEEGSRFRIKLNSIVRETTAMIEGTFPKNIQLDISLADDLAPVLGDATQLNQVLLNLCVNARDVMPDGGRLTIAGGNVLIDEHYAAMNHGVAPGPYVWLEVGDNGCGMTPEVIERIFEPFFTTKELGRGTGLGLSTALGIVRSHGGFINVYSEVGQGTSFKIHLPATGSTEEPINSDLPAPPLPHGDGQMILVVDDEVTILNVTRQTLEKFGYRVLTAEDGAQAVSIFVKYRREIAVVLTDMMMPVMDGPALIGALRRLEPHLPIIAASGLAAKGNVSRANIAGEKHFLAKPYSADKLLGLLRKILDKGLSKPPFHSTDA